MQILVNGLIAGLVIATLGLAFAVVYLPTRVFHIALGGVFAFTPFIAWATARAGMPAPLSWLAAIGSGVVIAVACEVLNHRRLARRSGSPGAHLISSLGIAILLIQCCSLIWGNETKVLRAGNDAVIGLGSVVITGAQIIQAVGAILVIGLFYGWLRLSRLGLQFRALADNPAELALLGIDVSRLRIVAFAVSGCLTSVASLLSAHELGFTPESGFPALLLAVVAAVIGGRESFVGPILGGLLLGVVRSQVVWYLSARWQEAATFALLAIFMVALPHGLSGKASRLEAEA